MWKEWTIKTDIKACNVNITKGREGFGKTERRRSDIY
jgi:hypothetical protein